MTFSWKQKQPYRVKKEASLNVAVSFFQRFGRPEETHNNTSPARTPQQQSPVSVSLKTRAAGKWDGFWQLSQWTALLKRRKEEETKRGEKVLFRAEKQSVQTALEPKSKNGKCNGIKCSFGGGKVCQKQRMVLRAHAYTYTKYEGLFSILAFLLSFSLSLSLSLS